MPNEQEARFDSMKRLVYEAEQAVSSIRQIAETDLQTVNNHSSSQAEGLQRVQQSAGTAVQALTEVVEIARHARSYQAQAHSRSQAKPH